MGRVCVIRHWYYPQDPRVHREVEALLRDGHDVDVICAGGPSEPRRERGRVSVWRIPIGHRRRGLAHYAAQYAAFLIAATALAGMLAIRRRYDVVQVNSLPDWLVFAAIVPRMLGARVLLDLHECMPEYYMTKYRLAARHLLIRALSALEQASIAFADFAITCTEQMRERFIERGADPRKVGVVLNACDEDRFDARGYPGPSADGTFTLVCHGTIEENYGTDLPIRAVALLKDDLPSLRLRVYGDGTDRARCIDLARELGVADRVWFSDGFVPFEELMRCIAAADAGVVAIRRDRFRDLTHCNKMYDLVALRRPAIISRTRAVEAYFGEGSFELFESDDVPDLARAIRAVATDPELRARLVARATAVGEPYRWMHQRERYLGYVRSLLPAPPTRVAVGVAAEKP